MRMKAEKVRESQGKSAPASQRDRRDDDQSGVDPADLRERAQPIAQQIHPWQAPAAELEAGVLAHSVASPNGARSRPEGRPTGRIGP